MDDSNIGGVQSPWHSSGPCMAGFSRGLAQSSHDTLEAGLLGLTLHVCIRFYAMVSQSLHKEIERAVFQLIYELTAISLQPEYQPLIQIWKQERKLL